MNDPAARELAAKLIDATRMPLDRTPLLEECVPDAPGVRQSAAATAKSQATAMPAEMVVEPRQAHNSADRLGGRQ